MAALPPPAVSHAPDTGALMVLFLAFGGTASAAAVTYAVDAVVRNRHGLPRADPLDAAARGVTATALLPVLGFVACAGGFAAFAGDPAAGGPGRSAVWSWAVAGVTFAVAHGLATAAAYASFAELAKTAPRASGWAGCGRERRPSRL